MSTNKKALELLQGLISKKTSINYLSSWIANLGVVPLFLLAAFLFVPPAFAFCALLIFVTAVLETIFPLLAIIKNKLIGNSESNLLQGIDKFVKVFVASACLLSVNQIAYAGPHEITMSIGEHKQFKLGPRDQFGITNKEVISAKHTKKTGLVVKAKSQGFSELIIFSSQGQVVYGINVIRKTDQRDLLWATGQLSALGLSSKNLGAGLLVSGTIRTYPQYKILKAVVKSLPSATLNVKLGENLKKIILTDVLYEFYQNFVDSVKCDIEGLYAVCQFEKGHTGIKQLQKALSQKYFVTFKERDSMPLGLNYSVKLKILQFENKDGREVNIGLSNLNVNLKEVIEQGVDAVTKNNSLLLSSKNIDVETLAEPTLLLQLGEVGKIKVGSETPYSAEDEGGNKLVTDWKFSGLSLDVKLLRINGVNVLEYKTGLSSQVDTSGESSEIASNKQKSKVSFEFGKPIEVFNIALKSNQKATWGLPFFKSIPIFGLLFRGTNTYVSHKKIIAIAEVKINE